MILHGDRASFDEAVKKFKLVVEKYREKLANELQESRARFEQQIVDEFTPKWKQAPPDYFARFEIEASEDNVREELRERAKELFEDAISFAEPKIKVLYKNVAPENVSDDSFLSSLRGIMEKRHVPKAIIASLFEAGQAAPEVGAFAGRGQ